MKSKYSSRYQHTRDYSKNVENYALSFEPYKRINPDLNVELERDLRPQRNRVLNDTARLKVSKQSFNVDAARLWNQAPVSITTAITLGKAKSAILSWVKSLPV